MGQKVNPNGIRLGITRTWDSIWYSGKNYGNLLLEDLKLRTYITSKHSKAGISKVLIERPAKKAVVTIYAAKPGLIIGKRGSDIDILRNKLSKMLDNDVQLNIVEERRPDVNAVLVAQGIADQIERRISYKKAMKRAIQTAMRQGALGIRVKVSGRIGGAEIARKEEYREGRVPLHTLRANVEFGEGRALTTYGIIGVKVWIYNGDVLSNAEKLLEQADLKKLNSTGK